MMATNGVFFQASATNSATQDVSVFASHVVLEPPRCSSLSA